MRFFVIDDDAAIRRLVAHAVRSIGAAEVCEFGDAETARDAVSEAIAQSLAMPDLVIVDINLPGMSGVELCSWLKAQPAFEDTPVIMISGDDHVLPHAFAAGAHDFVRKPLIIRELLVRLQAAIRFSQVSAARRAAAERAERELIFGQSIISSLSNMGVGLLAIGNRRLVYVNPALCALTGFAAEELYEYPDFIEIFHPDERARIDSKHLRRLEGADLETHYDTALIAKDGSRLDVEFSVSVWKMPEYNGVICLVRDIRNQLAMQRKLRNMAEYDMLTGLPNRRLMQDRLRQILHRCARLGTRAALLFIDLDGFKAVNDTHGHAVGDELLRQVGQRLSSCLRASDTASRLAGDEFVLILEEEHDSEFDPLIVAEKTLMTLDVPYRIGDISVRVTASIGIVITHGDPETVDSVLYRADKAMYRAKQGGKNACHLQLEDEEA